MDIKTTPISPPQPPPHPSLLQQHFPTAKVHYLIQDLQECIDSVSFEMPNYFAVPSQLDTSDPLVSTFTDSSAPGGGGGGGGLRVLDNSVQLDTLEGRVLVHQENSLVGGGEG